jgi:hypothetical protein
VASQKRAILGFAKISSCHKGPFSEKLVALTWWLVVALAVGDGFLRVQACFE